jgi:uncharacterized protein YbbC (DUF1343 family)
MPVTLGIDRLLSSEYKQLRGKRLGLIANQTSQTSSLVPTIDAIWDHEELELVALFGPEHGVRGDAQAGAKVEDSKDLRTGLPSYSLYGKTLKPTPEMLENVDALVFDIQDAGVRFFTYIYTMAYAMQAAAENGLEMVVLDRPNPITGVAVEGNVLEPGFESFVGLYPIALRHGMTVGELAHLFNKEFGINCNLTVIEMAGWKREQWYDETGCFWTIPGPNVPTLDSITVYPGTCLIEGTNVSEGRGTTRPFEQIGAPWIDARELWMAMRELNLPGVEFRQAHFVPTFHKYKDEPCHGIQLHITDRNKFQPVLTGLHLVATIKRLYPKAFAWREPYEETGRLPFDLLMGTDRVRKMLDEGVSVEEIAAGFEPELQKFQGMREKYLIY